MRESLWRRERDDLPTVETLRAGERSSGALVAGCLERNSSRAAMREVFGRMKEGEGNESSVGCVGLAGALEGALDASLGDTLDAAEALRFEKNFSSLSRPLAIANVWAGRVMLETRELSVHMVSRDEIPGDSPETGVVIFVKGCW